MGSGTKGGGGGGRGAGTVHSGPKLQALVYDILSRGGGKGEGGAAQEVLRNTIAMHGPSKNRQQSGESVSARRSVGWARDTTLHANSKHWFTTSLPRESDARSVHHML